MAATAGHRLAIEELNAWVALCLDHQLYDRLAEAFTDDARYVSGGRTLTGGQGIARHFIERAAAGGPRTTRHMHSGLRLRFGDDGRTARGASVCVCYAANAPAPAEQAAPYMVADFEDVYVLQADGFWRIGERVIRPVLRNASLAPGA